MDDEVPPLEDFEEELKTITNQSKPGSAPSADYTVPNARHIEDEREQQKYLDNLKKSEKQLETQLKAKEPIQPEPPKPYSGLKKGFLLGGPSKPKAAEPEQIKVTSKAKPLEIKEVQEAMKMNDYLEENKSQWMTNDFLEKVGTNPKIGKLFSNPEYIKAIDMFKTNPKEALARYGANKEFMESFREFCGLMGGQLMGLGPKKN